MFQTLIVQPIFNILVLIYALLPGHNFGIALILFTVLIRILLWPLVRKQLHQTKAMRAMQPDLKRIKKEAAGDRQKEAAMVMELYKERGISPFGSIGLLLVQLPILIALYSGLMKVVKDSHQIVEFAYPFLRDLSWMKQLAENGRLFDETLLGVVDLTRAAIGQNGIYWPAMLIVIASVITQYYQSKQLLPNDKNARKLRDIFKEASEGKQADQTELNAAIGRTMIFILPFMIFIFTVNLASALGLYLLVGSLVALVQQTIILRDDEAELESIADAKTPDPTTKTKSGKQVAAIPEAEIVKESTPQTKKSQKKRKGSKKKRRK